MNDEQTTVVEPTGTVEDTKPAEQWAEQKGLTKPTNRRHAPWELAVARHRFGWGHGRMLTEREFDAAIDEIRNIRIG